MERIVSDYSLKSDYTKSVDQTIANLDWVWLDSKINNSNFPISSRMIGKIVPITINIFKFGYYDGDNKKSKTSDGGYKNEYVIDQINRNGYRPSTLMELLSFATAYNNFMENNNYEQLHYFANCFPFFALGSVWNKEVVCMSVYNEGSKPCRLSLSSYSDWYGWKDHCNFLAVRK